MKRLLLALALVALVPGVVEARCGGRGGCHRQPVRKVLHLLRHVAPGHRHGCGSGHCG